MDNQIIGPAGSERNYGRRKFVGTLMAGAGATALLSFPGTSFAAGIMPSASTAPTIQQVIDIIIKNVPGNPFKDTVDTVKCGDPNQLVTGIVTTMFPTDEVIQKTARLGANFIIAHEPSFYNHTDETSWLANDEVYNYKKELLKKNNIVIWRFHDYIHTLRPDGILMGVLMALGWEKLYDPKNPNLITINASSLQSVINLSKDKLEINHVKYIGDLSQTCSRILILPGASGGTAQIKAIQKTKPDLLICGEINEWETSEYIRDLRFAGMKTALLILGHIVSEEPGLQWLVPWLKPQVPGITMTHIPSKDALSWA